jgi:glycolate oxidase FAD binding subunit
MTGALGALGILLEISLKVLPRPRAETTLVQFLGPNEAIALMNRLAAKPVPVSASAYFNARLYLRLSGALASVERAAGELGGEELLHHEEFWLDVREQSLPFFAGTQALWRLSLPPALPALALSGESFIEWGGAQRWLKTAAPADEVFSAATAHGGHASLFRNGDRHGPVFTPLQPGLFALHRRLKAVFDPEGIFNPGVMYPEL